MNTDNLTDEPDAGPTGIATVNGEFLPLDQARVSIFDRGFLFGDGVYEVVPVLEGVLIDREPFLERLGRSLEAIALDWPCEPEALLTLLIGLVERNRLREGCVYLQVTRGASIPREFSFPQNTKPSLTAFTQEKSLIDNPMAESGVPVITVEDLRWKRRDIKSVNLLAQVLAKQAAREQGAFEAWMTEGDRITEGGSSSAYIVKNDRVITRPLSRAILPGIRRKVLLEAARQHEIAVEERPFSLSEALDADEALLSSATTFILPVVSINGHPLGDGKPGPVTRRLRELFVEHALAEAWKR